jgi:putative endonuclease
MSKPSADSWYIYIIRCGDGSLYTGIARNVAQRLLAHEAGHGARYTRGRGPLELCAQYRCRTMSDALSLEYAIKQLPRTEKLALLEPRALGRFARRRARAATESQTKRARGESRRNHLLRQ